MKNLIFSQKSGLPFVFLFWWVPFNVLNSDSSHLAELLQLFVGVGVQFLGDVLHPEQSSSVLGAGLLHTGDCQQRVGDGAPPERLHFLVQAVQWRAQSHPEGQDEDTLLQHFSKSSKRFRKISSGDENNTEYSSHRYFLLLTSAWRRCTGPCWWRPSCSRPSCDRVRPGSAGTGRARSPLETSLERNTNQNKSYK